MTASALPNRAVSYRKNSRILAIRGTHDDADAIARATI
jgi:hypothetical protein